MPILLIISFVFAAAFLIFSIYFIIIGVINKSWDKIKKGLIFLGLLVLVLIIPFFLIIGEFQEAFVK